MVFLFNYSPPPFCLSLLFAAFIFSPRLSSAAVDFRYANCSQSSECGGIRDVAYPFWGGNRADYCGLPGLKLEECEFTFPRLTMKSEGQFRIIKLEPHQRKIAIAREDFLNGVCLTKFRNTAMSIPNIFNYADETLNLTLYYNCSFTRYSILSELNCTIDGRDEERLFNVAIPVDRCDSNFTVPIQKRVAWELQEGRTTLIDAITCGFELVWDEGLAKECRSCVESGGVCGHNSTQSRFACFCRDKPYPATCPPGQGAPTYYSL